MFVSRVNVKIHSVTWSIDSCFERDSVIAEGGNMGSYPIYLTRNAQQDAMQQMNFQDMYSYFAYGCSRRKNNVYMKKESSKF